eukprot:775173-Pelagomonas_calceolata.AAC.2
MPAGMSRVIVCTPKLTGSIITTQTCVLAEKMWMLEGGNNVRNSGCVQHMCTGQGGDRKPQTSLQEGTSKVLQST